MSAESLEPLRIDQPEPLGTPEAPFSPLYRLVVLASHVLEMSGTSQGHAGRSYAGLLKSLAEVVRDGQRRALLSMDASDAMDGSGIEPLFAFGDLWRHAGLEGHVDTGESFDWGSTFFDDNYRL